MKIKRFDDLNENKHFVDRSEYLSIAKSNDKLFKRASKLLNEDIESKGIGWKGIIKKLAKHKEEAEDLINEFEKAIIKSDELMKISQEWNKKLNKK